MKTFLTLELFDAKERKKEFKAVKKYYMHLASVCEKLSYQPKISVLIPVYRVNHEYFKECLESVTKQVYKNWELCIVDDCSSDPVIAGYCLQYQLKYPGKIHFTENLK